MGTSRSPAIILGAVGLLAIALWVLSTIAEALFGMPPWMRRDLEKRQAKAQIIDRARQAANWEWIQRHEAGERLSPQDYDAMFERHLREAAGR